MKLLSFLPNKLSVSLQELFVVEVSREEITVVIKHMLRNKSPGLDGYPIEFFFFQLGKLLVSKW